MPFRDREHGRTTDYVPILKNHLVLVLVLVPGISGVEVPVLLFPVFQRIIRTAFTVSHKSRYNVEGAQSHQLPLPHSLFSSLVFEGVLFLLYSKCI